MKGQIIKILESYIVDNIGETSPKIDIDAIPTIADEILALQLQQTGVSQQREQLISFFNWYKDDPKELSNNETLVDAYLEEINCG